jgi:hypothetical protein
MRPNGLHSYAKPLVEREPRNAPEYADERDRPLDFVLTPQEQDRAALAAIHLEANRRRLNKREKGEA